METVLIVLAILQLILMFCILLYLVKTQDKNKDMNRNFTALQDTFLQMNHLLRDEMKETRAENKADVRSFREELGQMMNQFNESVITRIYENSTNQLKQLDSFSQQLSQLTQLNESKFEKLRETVERHLNQLRLDNQMKLEEMRKTVDEKLNDTLEKRLGESFRMVSEKLEQVHRGLGEMQTLAIGVGDLKKVLSNVKTRGIWGEIQLGNLLEQILTPEQYATNIATVPNSNERVEFALKLPGRDEKGTPVWMPIDAKFPQEDYQRLLIAQENAAVAEAEESAKALEVRIKAEAKDIHTKYISVPYTTDFGILFLPIEGLYAEVLRRPGLCEYIMTTYHVVVAGPTTLAALLNSLQMGFRTLAIEKRSSEVWSILSAVKTEFGKFGDLLDKTHKKLQEASNSIDTAARKTRTIERKLKNVQELPQSEAADIFQLDETEDDDLDENKTNVE